MTTYKTDREKINMKAMFFVHIHQNTRLRNLGLSKEKLICLVNSKFDHNLSFLSIFSIG